MYSNPLSQAVDTAPTSQQPESSNSTKSRLFSISISPDTTLISISLINQTKNDNNTSDNYTIINYTKGNNNSNINRTGFNNDNQTENATAIEITYAGIDNNGISNYELILDNVTSLNTEQKVINQTQIKEPIFYNNTNNMQR